MTDNISRMYELAGIEKIPYITSYTLNTTIEDYPPFTDTNQLKLIKWLVKNWGSFTLYRNEEGFLCNCHSFSSCFCETEKQALAGLVCELWKDLTDTQKEEVKGILQ